jgi:acyl carrier protein
MNVAVVLHAHIVENYLGGDGSELRGDTSLLALNIVDSAAVLEIVHYLRTNLGVAVPIEDVTLENFESIDAIDALVRRLQGGASPLPSREA